MGDDNYAAAVLAAGNSQSGAYQFLQRLNAAVPASKLDRAITFLRERKLYALDIKQPRIPPKERPQTVLDKWMKERHK